MSKRNRGAFDFTLSRRVRRYEQEEQMNSEAKNERPAEPVTGAENAAETAAEETVPPAAESG